MVDLIIRYSFYLLFFLTPLFWTSLNYELFEYNKMILTYTLTVVIVGTWLLKIINQKSLIFNRTPLDIPLLLFLGANILSTIFSIDPHTSIWGYYSRSNGGLLSIVTYLLLYWAYVSNMDSTRVLNTLKIAILSGVIISFWGILEHFGISPSCIILRNEFNASCWVQDVQARVFATLGQPNWMAGYLSMLIFPTLYFFLTSISKNEKIIYFSSLISLYLGFTFTYSRGPTLGLIGGFVVFILFYTLRHPEAISRRISGFIPEQVWRFFATLRMTGLGGILLSFLIINLLFGSALTSFRLVSIFAAPARPTIALPPTSVTQLENGGTESGQIRFIVWRGALDIFKAYPVFGSGVETFAYSYYQFRPAEHNLTSEWDFLYNKAHNEYLNYLATTGIVGFGAYILVIGIFILWCLKRIRDKKLDSSSLILVVSLLASYISYLVYNFFLFSVVILAIFFYLFPGFVFILTNSTKPLNLPTFLNLKYLLLNRPYLIKISKALVIITTVYLLYSIVQLWYADRLFNLGQKASDTGNPGRAYNYLATAVELNNFEPFYKSELGYSAAASAAALKETDASLSADLKDEATIQTNLALTTSPKNVSFLRTAIRTYFELVPLDKEYLNKTLETIDIAIALAPTDPKLYFNKALILDLLGKKDEELKILQKALELKPNYLEARDQLIEATRSAGQ